MRTGKTPVVEGPAASTPEGHEIMISKHPTVVATYLLRLVIAPSLMLAIAM